MRMMDYAEYVDNMRTAYSNMYQRMTDSMQSYMEGFRGPGEHHHHHHGHRSDCDCCDCRGKRDPCHDHDCHCECCIRCADTVEYARCGETRLIPITFDNDSRRERDVKLQLGGFSTDGGLDLGWQASLSETEFKLPPCGEKTILLRVQVDCTRLDPTPPGTPDERRNPAVDSCKVAYATLRADGCIIRPLVIAVAILPNDCRDHRAGCLCGCCC
jgi:hypothetical protein